jgi:tetratricopeptide (TPR) repeat protein
VFSPQLPAALSALLLAPAAEPPAPAAAPVTQAEPQDPSFQRARQHFEDGNAHYTAGRYAAALEEFQAGYRLVPRPSFLLNMGQTYRKLEDLPKAKEAYIAYLRTLPDNSPLRAQIAQIVVDIELQLGQRPSEPVPRERKPVQPDLPLSDPFATPAPPAAPPPPPDDGKRRTWIGIGVGALGLALVGTGITLELLAHQESEELTALDRAMDRFDRDKERRGLLYERLGIGFLAAGGAALAAGTVLVVLGRREAARGADLSFSITPRAAGLTLRAGFR